MPLATWHGLWQASWKVCALDYLVQVVTRVMEGSWCTGFSFLVLNLNITYFDLNLNRLFLLMVECNQHVV